jgi:hypothetical protein
LHSSFSPSLEKCGRLCEARGCDVVLTQKMLGEKPVEELVGDVASLAPFSGSGSDSGTSSPTTSASRASETVDIMKTTVTETDSCHTNADENTAIALEKIKCQTLGTIKQADGTMKVEKQEKVHVEDFQILKLLGKGAYGKVYQVRRHVAPLPFEVHRLWSR